MPSKYRGCTLPLAFSLLRLATIPWLSTCSVKIAKSRRRVGESFDYNDCLLTRHLVINSTQSGAVCMNETMTHVAAEGLPFGGIGPSGSGHHNGKFGFDTFTHTRASLDPPGWLDKILSSRYPPYTDKKLNALSWLFPSLPARPTGPPTPTEGRSFTKWFLFALATVFAGLLTKKKILA